MDVSSIVKLCLLILGQIKHDHGEVKLDINLLVILTYNNLC